MSAVFNNIRRINKKDLHFINNQKLRILQREKKIKYLESLLTPSQMTFNELSKTSYNFVNAPHKSEIFKLNKNKQLNFPKININPNKTVSSYDRMRNYKVFLSNKKRNITKNRIQKFIMQSGLSYTPINKETSSIPKVNVIKEGNTENNNYILIEKNNKESAETLKNIKISSKKNNRLNDLKNDIKQNFLEEKPNTNRSKVESVDSNNQKKKKYKKINFDYYLKMQTKAEIALRPKLGEESNDLIEYIKAIKDIRNNIIENIISEINNTENRFNNENPEVDSNFTIKDKSLYLHKWKNLFYIKDYQKFFLKGLKGKISDTNYYQMQKKFLEINNICFANSKGQPIKTIEWPNDIQKNIKNIK